ncbi:hypothetical protein MCOR27_001520 [Pyricularia oryzae]|uniref:Uncharacterized protein n=2 Tax=Pyricularia TaxID=48558 RepID=A0ABQ8NRL1_PYRGI|nr:hypothetical protein MCOR01_010588 [Pyricularia oryzae]KAI6301117.1 hypothetical protein MCOR33_003299 [Pyricularia grisea]KAH9438403.1 hypothetical protein MCOR02_002036 [Pyricularia oryzae]KAI6262154.1 hypothetical protein MCOR19_001661 [Pyricularia oryzae]KAI6269731.1 hypothetical protein MCOR26_008564 [Pyricularia oryzae]
MNINDLNNSGPSSADQTASMSAAAAYAAAQGDAAAARQIASGQWSTKRMQEEFDHAKAGLVHKDFKPTDYPDPLRPRHGFKNPYAGKYPQDAEKQLKEFLNRADAKV